MDDDASPHAGTEDDPEHAGRACSCAVRGLGQGEAVGIVSQAYGALQQVFQVALQVLAVQAGGVGVLDAAVVRRAGTGDADTNAAAISQLPLGFAHQLHYGV